MAGRGPEVLERLVAGIPVGRIGRPEEVAAAVCFLAGPDAGYISGATLDVNGGRFVGCPAGDAVRLRGSRSGPASGARRL